LNKSIPTIVLGATGYVGGEVLRLLAMHPNLYLEAAVARSAVGQPLSQMFPHLTGIYDNIHFVGMDGITFKSGASVAVFSCLPHGTGAAQIDQLIRAADNAGCEIRLVDLSADFRLESPELYLEVYGHEHQAKSRYEEFDCALPELTPGIPSRFIAHPGCFTTAATLACAPLLALGMTTGTFRISAVTGSTGSGRDPKDATHHPERHSNLSAYNPLLHRHTPEMEMLIARSAGESARVRFVPHSGPFARGIHATIFGELIRPMDAAAVTESVREFYEHAPFITVSNKPPRLKDVVGSNRCHLGVSVSETDVVIFSVIDNLIKGAAGGAVQWMNRLQGFPETAGLMIPALGWI
jgi:N-acetyl-gamma-glutamyl-phosphate reductase